MVRGGLNDVSSNALCTPINILLLYFVCCAHCYNRSAESTAVVMLLLVLSSVRATDNIHIYI